jgi:hypothetical protein
MTRAEPFACTPDPADELHAVHARHVEVAHDDVRRALQPLQNRHCGIAAGGLVDRSRRQCTQYAHERIALESVILDDQKSKVALFHFPESRRQRSMRVSARCASSSASASRTS